MVTSNSVSAPNDQHSTKSRKTTVFILKVLMAFIGIALLSLGAAFLREAGLGMDPFTALNIGMATKTHMSLGTFQLITNFIIVIFVFLFDRKLIGIGTIMNMVLVGFEIQWFTDLYAHFFPPKVTIFVMITDLVIGIILFTLGTSLYMAPNLGVAPYDAIAPIISTKTKIQYKVVRMIQDFFFLVLAFLALGPVGPMSILVAFFAGPLISYWNRKISDPLVKEIEKFGSNPVIKTTTNTINKATKTGYNSLKSAYNTTLEASIRKPGNNRAYSNKELKNRLDFVQHQMKVEQKKYFYYQKQYNNLLNELEQRTDNSAANKATN